MSKPFFFRIESAELLNFATDPEGEGMTLLRFAKELQKGESDVVFIQSIIDEARNYVEKKRNAGSKGGKAKASSAIAVLGSAVAKPSTPLARSSSSNRSKYKGEFDRIWKRYPNKAGKTSAEKKFYSTVTSAEKETEIHLALDKYLAHLTIETWKRPQSGSTWFNQWQDWVDYEHVESGGEISSQQAQLNRQGAIY